MKTARCTDSQGRIIIPNHIRKALDLTPETRLDITLEDDNTIRIKIAETRCVICGEGVDGRPSIKFTVGAEKKHVCANCSKSIEKVGKA